MGVGPPVLALYRQLKELGVFDGVSDVMELGAQAVWCPKEGLVKDLFRAFGKPPPRPDMLERFASWKGSARELYTGLGFSYQCIDVDPSNESIRLDLNFDPCPPEHKGKYAFVTNHGTSEHLLNQKNFFEITHDLTKPGGYMLHAVPFNGQFEHGFFNYQPNFFDSLARYNSYKMLGVWIGPDWQIGSFIPWEPLLLDYLVINSKTTQLLIVLMQKMYNRDFCVPFQGIYEAGTPDNVMERYCLVVDGDYYDGKRVKHITKERVVEEQVARETTSLRNEYAALHGKYWEAMSKLAAAETRIEKELDPLRAELATSILKQRLLEDTIASNGKLTRVAIRGNPSGLAHISGRDLLSELVKRVRRRVLR
jgi:hypothetical protein